jgi:phage gpG-like protein
MLNIKTVVSKEDLAQLKRAPDLIMKRLHQAFGGWLSVVRKTSQRDYFSGRPHLISRHGMKGLKGSLFTNVTRDGYKLKGELGAKKIYARIHEFGGQAGRNLASTIPKRPYLKPALMDRDKIFESYMKAKLDKTV